MWNTTSYHDSWTPRLHAVVHVIPFHAKYYFLFPLMVLSQSYFKVLKIVRAEKRYEHPIKEFVATNLAQPALRIRHQAQTSFYGGKS